MASELEVWHLDLRRGLEAGIARLEASLLTSEQRATSALDTLLPILFSQRFLPSLHAWGVLPSTSFSASRVHDEYDRTVGTSRPSATALVHALDRLGLLDDPSVRSRVTGRAEALFSEMEEYVLGLLDSPLELVLAHLPTLGFNMLSLRDLVLTFELPGARLAADQYVALGVPSALAELLDSHANLVPVRVPLPSSGVLEVLLGVWDPEGSASLTDALLAAESLVGSSV